MMKNYSCGVFETLISHTTTTYMVILSLLASIWIGDAMSTSSWTTQTNETLPAAPTNMSFNGYGGICFPHESDSYPKSYGSLLAMSGYNSTTALKAPTLDTNPKSTHVGFDVRSTESRRKYVSWAGDASLPYNSNNNNLSASNLAFTKGMVTVECAYIFDFNFTSPFTASNGDVHVYSATAGDVQIKFDERFAFHNNHSHQDLGRGHKSRFKVGLVIIVLLVSILLTGFTLFRWFTMLWRRRSCYNIDAEVDEEAPNNSAATESDHHEALEIEAGPKRFSYSELCHATADFAEEFKIGEGGFGPVFRGSLEAANQSVDIAVKKLKCGSAQGKKEFLAEINIIGNLRHRNLVKLIGWCYEYRQQLLVYELMPNSSLDKHLFGHNYNLPSLLSWETRYKIACGLASALQYLHEGYDKCVIHRDIKSSNVMLDSAFNPRLGDFGLARLTQHGQTIHFINPAGSIGYMAPELFTEKPSKESDVYSFGIVALEIATDRKPTFEASSLSSSSDKTEEHRVIVLANWVRDLEVKGRLVDAVDQRLGSEFDKDQAMLLIEVGLRCCHIEASTRPSMNQVIASLGSFFSPGSSSTASSCLPAASLSQYISSEYCTPNESFRESEMVVS